MSEYDPDHYAFRRRSGLHADDFRDERRTRRIAVAVALVIGFVLGVLCARLLSGT